MRLLCPLICFCGQGVRSRHNVMFVAAQTSICRSAQSSLNLRVERLMKNLLAITVGMTSLLLIDSALAQNGNMMNGGMSGAGWMGGYAGAWGPILLLIVVIGLVVWVLQRKGK